MTEWKDKPINELLPEMDRLVARGAIVWLKYTCPKCGDRIVVDEQNTWHPEGYDHTMRADGSTCGGRYIGHLFGLRVALPLEPPVDNWAADPRNFFAN